MENVQIPELLTTTPLYQRISLENPGGQVAIRDVIMYSGTFDSFCPGCAMTATFNGSVTSDWQRASDAQRASLSAVSRVGTQTVNPFAISNFVKTVRCTRDKKHFVTSYFQVSSDRTYFQKVGQYQSVADILKGETSELASELGRDLAREFNMAITASAHGVGIGAHIYLRRIFESLVEDAHTRAKAADAWDEAAYERARMAEKVSMLRAELPAFLAEHPQLYSVLSVHLHALSEEEARQNFERLKQAILIIAEQKREVKKAAEREKAARRALGELVKEVAPASGAAKHVRD
ncbi:hypothetical protein BLA6993_05282 [Burkholderia lata]|uniref:hypothetical protein n=1 Tax=Burkholderia lata (strain ATCC 17760 / DSM 23089 / LMG 22485 / NCIMB 9086 / R18194 / 383) TaxID=482957 RepID=UPI0014543BF4|nr:hypothetical protein [Burkholderia lata]VWC09904.1 hypothetical protein BLA6993_05282 [Burkholderia lata]